MPYDRHIEAMATVVHVLVFPPISDFPTDADERLFLVWEALLSFEWLERG
jgi:hypothetical protein